MIRPTFFLFILIAAGAREARSQNDSLEYIILETLTRADAWVSKYKGSPPKLDEDQFSFLKQIYPKINLTFTEVYDLPAVQREVWDPQRVGKRKLKPNSIRLPLIGSPPRRKEVSYVSRPLFLNKEKTIAIVNWSTWGNLGWNNSSGWGEMVIFRLENGRWKRDTDPLGAFTT